MVRYLSRILFLLRLIFAIATSACCLCACSAASVPIIPFDAGKAGSQSTAVISSTVARPWQVNLVLITPHGSSVEFWRRNYELMQEITRFNPTTGLKPDRFSPQKPQRDIEFSVKIERVESTKKQSIRSYTVTSAHPSPTPGGVGMSLGPAICLPPGTYEFTVTAMKDDERLKEPKIGVFVGNDPRNGC